MNTRKLKIILAATGAAVIAPASVRAQEVKTLYILKDNAVVYSSPVSEIDSIIFYDPEPAVTPPEFSAGSVKSTLPAGKLTFMVYNLGADPACDTPEKQMAYPSPVGGIDSDGVTDTTVYGALFQWGRPADGHQLRTSATTMTPATVAPPGHGDFILASNRITPQDDGLWGVPKTTNDPCPEGWRIPTIEEWQSIFDEASGNTIIRNKAEEGGTKGIKFSPDGENYTFFLPAAGNRNPISGGLIQASRSGDYWSGTVNGKFSFKINFQAWTEPSYSYTASNISRGLAHSCRCIKEY